jgi:hypothetical protein
VISRIEASESESILQNTVEMLIFFAIRHCELSLFRTLQNHSNGLKHDDTENKHAYIRCILKTLLCPVSLTKSMTEHLKIVSALISLFRSIQLMWN